MKQPKSIPWKWKVKLLHKCETIKGFKLYLLWLIYYNKMTTTRNVKPQINKLNMSGGPMVTWDHLTLKPLNFDLFSNMGNSHNLSMKEGCFFVCFVCHIEISQIKVPFTTILVPLESPIRGAPNWFHNVLTYFGEVIEYWAFFSQKKIFFIESKNKIEMKIYFFGIVWNL